MKFNRDKGDNMANKIRTPAMTTTVLKQGQMPAKIIGRKVQQKGC